MEDQVDLFLYYIADAPPYTAMSILESEVTGIEYFNNRNGTICRFYSDMNVTAIRANKKLEYRSGDGTYINNMYLHRHFNVCEFADFWHG